MKVLVVSTIFPPPFIGGAEQTVYETCTALSAAGHDVTVLSLKGTPRRSLETDGQGVKVERIPSRFPYWPFDGQEHRGSAKAAWHALDAVNPLRYLQVRRRIRNIKPEVVLVHQLAGWSISSLSAIKHSGRPVAVVLHDYGLACVRRSAYRLGSNCESVCTPCQPRAWLLRKTWKKGWVAIGVSSGLLARYDALANLTFSGDTEVGYPLTVEAQPLRIAKYPRIGYLGRLEQEKGVEDLVEYSRVSGTRIRLAGAGDEQYVEHLSRLAHGTPAQLVGWQNSIEFLDSLEVLVVPSRWAEPFGRVVGEAAARGCALVLAAQPGLIEAAIHAHANYTTFEPGNLRSLDEAITRAVNQRFELSRSQSGVPLVDAVLNTLTKLSSREG